MRAPCSATERLRAPALSVKAGMDNEKTRLDLDPDFGRIRHNMRIKIGRRRTSGRGAPSPPPRCREAMRGAARRRARPAYRRDLEEGCGLQGGLRVANARREVVWMRESLGGGLRGMRMGRVSAGRTRVTVNSTNKLGRLFRTAEK
jgi:hypothetical protein